MLFCSYNSVYFGSVVEFLLGIEGSLVQDSLEPSQLLEPFILCRHIEDMHVEVWC